MTTSHSHHTLSSVYLFSFLIIKFGNGCTSGHGICGLARRSFRSLIAVVTFMMTGAFSSSVCAPDCFLASCLRTTKDSLPEFYPTNTSKMVGYILTALCIVASFVAYDTYSYCYCVPSPTKTTSTRDSDKDRSNFERNLKIQYRKIPAAICSAILFSVGLAISGMIENRHIVGFLDMKGFSRGTWDPILLFVMGGGLLVSLISYEFVPGYSLMMVRVHKNDSVC